MVLQYKADLEISAERMQALISEFKASLRKHDVSHCRKLITRIEGELTHVSRISHQAELMARHDSRRQNWPVNTNPVETPRMQRGRTGV